MKVENNSVNIIQEYFKIKGENFKRNGECNVEDCIENINDFIDNKLFLFKVKHVDFSSCESIPPIFILELDNRELFIIKKDGSEFINITDSQPFERLLQKKRKAFYFEKKIKATSDVECLDGLMSMTPRVSYFTIPLVVFSLITPFYSNIFNGRLVYSDNFNSVFIITLFFVALIFIEFYVRKLISSLNLSKIKNNIIICNVFFLHLLKITKKRKAAINIRTAESSLFFLWENKPLIFTELSFCILFSICLLTILGIYSIPLFIFYIVTGLISIVFRFSTYKKQICMAEYSHEKLSMLIDIENRKKYIKFLNTFFLEEIIKRNTNKDEYLKMKIHGDNHKWNELIRVYNPFSMFVLFCSSYFAVSSGDILASSLIALMIINSRLSSSFFSGINKMYFCAVNYFHLKRSLNFLFQDTDKQVTSHGIYFNNLESLRIINFSLSFDKKSLIRNVTLNAKKGDVIGIIGRSGSGKTAFIRCLIKDDNSYTGDVLLNNINIRNVSDDFFKNCVSLHSSESAFFMGTLKDNFYIYGVDDDNIIIKTINEFCPNLKLTGDMLYNMDVSELNLSNGEKQKLLLALSVIKKPLLIFLDESTSFLSSDDARDVISKVKKMCSDSIIFLATHDLSLIDLCSSVITLEKKAIRNSIHIPMIKR